MIRELRSFRLLAGYRGAQACDVEALEEVVLRIAALADDHPAIAEIDCNPVIVSASGAVVVDARVRVAEVASTSDWRPPMTSRLEPARFELHMAQPAQPTALGA